MRKVHLWGDWVGSDSQNSQPFSQKSQKTEFFTCPSENLDKNLSEKNQCSPKKICCTQFYISCFINFSVTLTKKPGHSKNTFSLHSLAQSQFHSNPKNSKTASHFHSSLTLCQNFISIHPHIRPWRPFKKKTVFFHFVWFWLFSHSTYYLNLLRSKFKENQPEQVGGPTIFEFTETTTRMRLVNAKKRKN